MTPTLLNFARRVGTSCIVLLGVSMLIFVVARVIPGDPARIALGPNATAEQIAKLRAELRLDEPIVVQYGHFLSDLAQGDLGISLYTNRPVAVDIAQFLPATLELILVAGAMMIAIGLPLGIASARYRGTWVDNSIRMVALLGVSAPSFVWAVILMLLFAYFLPIFPVESRPLGQLRHRARHQLPAARHADRRRSARLRQRRLAHRPAGLRARPLRHRPDGTADPRQHGGDL